MLIYLFRLNYAWSGSETNTVIPDPDLAWSGVTTLELFLGLYIFMSFYDMKINQEIVLLLFLLLYFQESKRLTRIFSYLTPSPSTPPDRKKSGRRKCQQLVQEGTWFFFPKAGLTNSCHFLSIRTRFFLSTVIEKIETNKIFLKNHLKLVFFSPDLGGIFWQTKIFLLIKFVSLFFLNLKTLYLTQVRS